MDADFSHDPEVLPLLLAEVARGAGRRGGLALRAGRRRAELDAVAPTAVAVGNGYARFMLRLRLQDATTACRAYRADTLERIDIDGTRANGYLFQIETAFRLSDCGARIVELPITFLDRAAGPRRWPSCARWSRPSCGSRGGASRCGCPG